MGEAQANPVVSEAVPAVTGNTSLHSRPPADLASGRLFSKAKSLLDSVATHRGISQELVKLRHLALQLLFLQRLNGMVERSLRHGVSLGVGASFLDRQQRGDLHVLTAALVREVHAGGRTAGRALRELASLSGDSDARSAMVAAGAVRAAETLLKRPSTDEAIRAAAGSFLTLLTNLPVTAEISNEVSGSGGHIEIVLPRPSRVYGPDAAVAELSAGVLPSRIE